MEKKIIHLENNNITTFYTENNKSTHSRKINYHWVGLFTRYAAKAKWHTLLWILEAPFLSILLDANLKSKPIFMQAHFYHFHLLLWRFNGLWARLLDLQKWDISSWTPLMKEETFNNPCENVFFVIEFDLQEDRDLIVTLRL